MLHSDPAGKLSEDFSMPKAPPMPQISRSQVDIPQPRQLASAPTQEFTPAPIASVDLDGPSESVVKQVTVEVKPVPKKVMSSTHQEKPIKQTKQALIRPKGWLVQLAVFSNRTNAENLEKKLHTKGFPVILKRAKNAKGIEFTRLLVGPEKDRQSAQNLAQRLQQDMNMKGFVRSAQS